MSEAKIKVGITQGDINGIGYEVIIKSLLDPRMCELCTPVVYGSAKAAGFYRRQVEDAENFNFNIIGKASEANPRRVNLIDCTPGELRIEPGQLTAEGLDRRAEGRRRRFEGGGDRCGGDRADQQGKCA